MVFVVDVAALLDRSREGQRGAAQLQAQFAKAQQALFEAKREAPVDEEAYAAKALSSLERQRTDLREALLARVRSVVEALRAELGAALVVDKDNVVATSPDIDITEAALARLDATG
jgi:Skp family chaperone for outer membrane proteins